MIAIAVVLAVSVALAVAASAAAASTRWHLDPVDPSAEVRGVERAVRRSHRVRSSLRRRVDRWSAGTMVLVAALVVLLSMAVLLGLLLEMIDENAGFARADTWVARWGAEHATTTSTRFIEAVTQLGARPVVVLALVAAALVDWRRHGNREVFFFVVVVALGEMLMVNTLKVAVGRDRPDIRQLVHAGGHSFPSGHTSAAAAGWMAIALVLGRNRSRRTRIALSGGAVLVAAAVATSRALLGVHWCTDVIAGLAVGWSWYLVVAIAFGGRRQRLGAPLRHAAPDLVAPRATDQLRSAPPL